MTKTVCCVARPLEVDKVSPPPATVTVTTLCVGTRTVADAPALFTASALEVAEPVSSPPTPPADTVCDPPEALPAFTVAVLVRRPLDVDKVGAPFTVTVTTLCVGLTTKLVVVSDPGPPCGEPVCGEPPCCPEAPLPCVGLGRYTDVLPLSGAR